MADIILRYGEKDLPMKKEQINSFDKLVKIFKSSFKISNDIIFNYCDEEGDEIGVNNEEDDEINVTDDNDYQLFLKSDVHQKILEGKTE